MASAKLAAVRKQAAEDAKMDMSPMIDMVFLLLIFFMIASRMVTVRVDPEIKPPVADEAKKPEVTKGRFILNVYPDGTFKNAEGSQVWTEEDITQKITAFREHQEARGNKKTILQLRAHKDATVRDVKKATAAAARGGVINVVFGTFQTDKQFN